MAVGCVDGIEAKSERVPGMDVERQGEILIDPPVEREENGIPLAVRRSGIIVELIDIGVGKTGVQINGRGQRNLPRKFEQSKARQPIGNVGRQAGVNVGADNREFERHENVVGGIQIPLAAAADIGQAQVGVFTRLVIHREFIFVIA